MTVANARALAVILTISVLLMLPIPGSVTPSSHAAGFSGISVDVQCPPYAGAGEKVPVVVTARGGPAYDVGGNYTFKGIEVKAKNDTGIDYNPKSDINEAGVFKFNITMPQVGGQTIEVSMNVTSKAWKGDDETYTHVSFKIKVIEPVVIAVDVFNRGLVDAVNATANFYADGVLIHKQTFNVSAGSSTTLYYNWTVESLRKGKHVIAVVIDEANDLVEFSDGNNVYTRAIYVGKQTNPAGAILTIAVIFVSVFFVLTYLQKPVRRGKKF